MYGWIDGWTDGQTDIWKFPLVSYSISALKGRCLKRKEGRIERKEGRKEGRKGEMAGRNEQMEGKGRMGGMGGREEGRCVIVKLSMRLLPSWACCK